MTSSTYTVGVDNTAENQGVALYAHYNNTQYSIELDLAGGEFEEGYTYPTSYTYWDEEPLIKIPIPVRKGYTFQHWAKIENGEEEEWAYNLIIRKTDHHKNLKFIAKWQIKPYDIEYAPDYDGGELPEGNPTSYTIEDEISLKPATKIGYEFLGWKVAVKSLGNDNAENPIDGTIINKIPKGTTGWLNLSATFGKKPIIYKISYELNAPGEEINEPENNQYTVNDALIIYPPESNKKGYKFAGWYTDSSLADKYRLPESEGGSQYIKKGTTGDLTLYAKWEEPPKYTIVFDLNGHGEAIESQTVYEGESIEKPEDPSAEGYIFKGWYPGDSSEKWEFDSDIVNNSYADKDNVITLHAKWRNAINPAKNWTELTETPDEIYLDEGVTAEDAAEFASDKINKMISIIIYGGSREEGYLVLSSSGGEGFEELEVRFTYETLVEELIPMVNIEPYASMYGIYVIGTTSNALGESEPRVDEVSLSLSEGTIGINFYMKNVSALADGNTYISVGGKESLITAPENGNKFVYSGFVNAKDMDKDIEVKIYRKGEGDSIDIIPLKNESADSNGIFKYSVNDYLERVRGRSDELGTLATAMQNYGLCSQYYFSNEEKGTLPSVASEIDYENYKANIGEILPEGFSYAGSSLILTSSTSIRHYFRADDISKLTFKVNGVDKTDTVVAMNGMYYIEIQGINSTNLDEKHSFAVSDGSKTFEMEYCALSYCEKVTSKSSNEVLKTLANSLYWYNKAAKDYFN